MSILLLNAGLILTLMGTVWLTSLFWRDVSLIDRVWGLGFIGVAWLTWGVSVQVRSTCYLLPVMVTIWGLRLSLYLTYRNWGQGEDKRYAQMRQNTGDWFPVLSLVTVFGLQGVLMWIIALPLQLGIPANPGVVNVWTFLGVGCWLLGLLLESVSDWQQMRFQANPANQGQVLDRGLWRYTRHPNYFGDCLVWWGFWMIAVSPGLHYWTIISPLLMSGFLMFVSGVTLLERDSQEAKPASADSIRRTSPFFPWFPKSPVAED